MLYPSLINIRYYVDWEDIDSFEKFHITPGLAWSIVFALLAAALITPQALLIRYLDIKAGIPGNITAFSYLFFEGCIGTVALLIYTGAGGGIFDVGIEHFLWVCAAGILITIGLVLQNYALSIGIAGVTYSIVNFSVAL